MLTERLTKAMHDAEFLRKDLRAAYKDAIAAGDRFAEVAIYRTMEDTASLVVAVSMLKHAAETSGKP